MNNGYMSLSNKLSIYVSVLLMVLSPLAVTNRAYAATISFTANTAATVLNSGDKIYMNSATYGANVTVDSVTRAMTGYAWSNDVGWVYFGSGTDNPSGPVSVDTGGLVSGKAKVLTGDYIDFNASPSGANVTAGSTGEYDGYAWSAELGWIDFSGVTTVTGLPTTIPPPTLSVPSNGATNINTLPEFRLGSADVEGDYIRYKIQVCSDSACSSVVRTIDQTASQVGWTSQGSQTGTAYSGGSPRTQYAVHQYQPTALTPSTQYWWRSAAIDPGGTNTWSNWSSIYSFTTESSTPGDVTIGGGGITINPNTRITTGN